MGFTGSPWLNDGAEMVYRSTKNDRAKVDR